MSSHPCRPWGVPQAPLPQPALSLFLPAIDLPLPALEPIFTTVPVTLKVVPLKASSTICGTDALLQGVGDAVLWTEESDQEGHRMQVAVLSSLRDIADGNDRPTTKSHELHDISSSDSAELQPGGLAMADVDTEEDLPGGLLPGIQPVPIDVVDLEPSPGGCVDNGGQYGRT